MSFTNSIFVVFLAVICFRLNNARVRDTYRIRGGNETFPGEFKYVVSLGSNDTLHFCGGGIIANRFILSAGHCFVDEYNNFMNHSNLKIVAGINYLLDNNDPRRLEIEVERVYILDSINITYNFNDIAVVKLRKSLDLKNNKNLQKLRLPTGIHRKYTNRHAVVAGFGWDEYYYVEYRNGTMYESGDMTGKLRSANAVVYSNAKCQDYYLEPILNSHICAKMIKHKHARRYGICGGDSGSPLVYKNKTVIGVVSANSACDETVSPTIYTRVTSYIDFIENAMKDKTDNMMVKEF